MGGKEGGRGYLYQGVVSVINSLTDSEWMYVQVEPDSNDDKVDLAFFFENNEQKVIQVKSSINNFSKTSIMAWLKSLTSDVPTARQFDLILIGNCENETKKFINRINEKKLKANEISELSVLAPYLDKLNIQIENFELNSMESKIYKGLHKFLYSKGHSVDATTLDMMTGAIIYQFMVFSTKGKKVSKADFEKRVLNWIYFNYPNVNGEVVRNNLLVEFYLKDRIPFSTTMSKISFQLKNSDEVNTRKEEILSLMEDIDSYIIKEKKETPPAVAQNDILNNFQLASLTTSSGEYSEELKEELTRLSHTYLDVSLEDSFFNLGNLKKKQGFMPAPFTSSVELIGSEVEKEKYQKLLDFGDNLFDLESLLNVFEFIERFLVVPLILKNEGNRDDERIKVVLKIPKDIKVLTSEEMIEPDYNIIDSFTGYSSYFDYMLHHQKDSRVMEYPLIFNDLSYARIDILDSYDEKRKRASQKFSYFIDALFNFEVHESKDNTELVFHFDELNPKENIAFPCFLLLEASSDFTIEYEITSKNLADVSTGNLFIRFKF
ncbi:hypothetical protein QW71_34160 [Paenibacillus sp. IHB B 3415]|uniref:hypothetical protein n=1 Tax=Paenibacillus sp. IHB B 3415 TaxID=867080 RepID=UPI0005734E39|nr:hypothetical protein [Paenibacillus sp. IHB B 3415]KHL91499.1 hypothetical protein QW71_34160 [Paenibacillus sp. IHB B 3415]